VLRRTRLTASDGTIQLHVKRGEEALIGDAVERRLIRLAQGLGCEAAIVSG
jgi:hypothetical protein